MPSLPVVRRACVSLILPFLFASCGGDGGGTDPDPTDAVASVSVAPATGQVDLGATLQLSATVRNGRNEVVSQTVSWSSSDAALARVDANGLVTGVAPGAVTITASAGGRSGTAAVESRDPNPPAAPGNVQATPVSHTEVDITWTDNSASETGVIIRREEVAAGPSSGVGGANGVRRVAAVFVDAGTVGADETSFRDSGLSPGATYRYEVDACNDAGCSGGVAGADAVTTFEALTIDTPDPLPHGQVGVAYSVDLQSSGPDASWSLSGGALPAGVELSSSGTISGTPTQGGSFTPVVMAEGGGQIVTKALGLTIVTPPAVATTSLPDGVRGVAYGADLTATGGDGAFVWGIVSGALPPGLLLSVTGAITGAPAAAGSFSFTVQVLSADLAATAALTIDVFDPLTVSTAVLSAGVLNTAYTEQLQATGGDGGYLWSVSAGSLPAGITMDGSGALSGTPTALGTSNFTVEVTSGDGQSASADLSIDVNDQVVAPSVTTTSLPDGGVGGAYAAQLMAANGDGTYAWAVTGGGLPAGLNIEGATGMISGTPTTEGTSNVTIEVTSAGLSGTAPLSITVHAALSVATTALPPGVDGVPYGSAVTADGGDGSNAFTVASGSLPPGLELAVDGQITGTPGVAPTPPAGGPMAVGTSNFTVEVSNDLGQTAQRALSISIFLPLGITTASLPNGTVGGAYSQTVQASGGDGSYGWTISAGALPNGLNLNPTSGQITGLPTGTETANFTVRVTSGDGQVATKDLSITIGSAPPQITTTSLPGGMVGAPYNQTVVVFGGDGSFAWSIVSGSLPGGLGIGATDGVISGTPLAAGTFNFTVEVTSASQTDTQALSITIAASAVSFGRSFLPCGNVGVPYSATPAPATGGSGAFTYAVTGGAMPTGFSIDSSDGTISGTPGAAGMSFFEITATSGGSSASVVFGFTISGAASSGFNLCGINVADVIPAAAVQAAVDASLARYEAAITGDAPGSGGPLPSSGLDGFCGGNGALFHGQTVDDVVVLINIAPIDGPGNIAGQGGLCLARSPLPSPPTIGAQLTLDSDDLGGLSASLKFALMFHELGHGMGLSDGIWTAMGLSTGSGGMMPEYIGALAVGEFQSTLGQTGNPPLEETGGSGTAYSHWDEAFFDTEVMTGFLDGSGNPVSTMTIAALGDLGWSGISFGAADAYSIPGCSPTCVAPPGAPGVPGTGSTRIPLGDDVIRGPIALIGADGTIRVADPGGR